jgi:hypothetical protein
VCSRALSEGDARIIPTGGSPPSERRLRAARLADKVVLVVLVLVLSAVLAMLVLAVLVRSFLSHSSISRWEEAIWRSSDMSWPTLGRDDGEMLTQENASLRKSGGHSGHSAEKALYSTPKF